MKNDNLKKQINAQVEYIDLQRIIYYWRRYAGIRHKDTKGKFYSFEDLNILERRLKKYFDNPQAFDFDNPTLGIDSFGFEEDYK